MKKTSGAKIVVANETIDFTFFDRRSDTTLFCIHGINSSKTFIGSLNKYETRYNIFSYSYGALRNLEINNIIAVTKKLIATRFARHKLIVIAHSFGGYIATKLFDHQNVTKYIFINTIHPLTFGYRPFKQMLTVAKNSQNLILKNHRRLKTRKENGRALSSAIEKRTRWSQVLCEISDQSARLKQELMGITNQKDKSVFIRSSGDFIISSRLLARFLNRQRVPSKMLHYPGHAPLSWETKRTYALFGLGQ